MGAGLVVIQPNAEETEEEHSQEHSHKLYENGKANTKFKCQDVLVAFSDSLDEGCVLLRTK